MRTICFLGLAALALGFAGDASANPERGSTRLLTTTTKVEVPELVPVRDPATFDAEAKRLEDEESKLMQQLGDQPAAATVREESRASLSPSTETTVTKETVRSETTIAEGGRAELEKETIKVKTTVTATDTKRSTVTAKAAPKKPTVVKTVVKKEQTEESFALDRAEMERVYETLPEPNPQATGSGLMPMTYRPNTPVRLGPSLRDSVISWIPAGVELDIENRVGNWYRVRTRQHLLGWIPASVVVYRRTDDSRRMSAVRVGGYDPEFESPELSEAWIKAQ